MMTNVKKPVTLISCSYCLLCSLVPLVPCFAQTQSGDESKQSDAAQTESRKKSASELASEPPKSKEILQQELKDLVAQARQFIAAGDLSREVACIERIAKLERKIHGPRHTEVAGSLQHLAPRYAELRQFDKARDAAREAQSIYAEVYGKEYYRCIDCKLLLPHVDRLAALDDDQWRQWKALPEQEAAADQFAARGQLGNALRQQEQYLRAVRALVGVNHPKFIDGLRTLALRCSDAKQFDTAVTLLGTARDISAKLQGEKHPEYGMVLIYLGMVFEAAERLPEAAEQYQKAMDNQTAVYPASHPDRMVALGSLARVQFKLKRYEQAAENWQSLVPLIAGRDGEGSPEHLFLLKMLALSHNSAGQPSKAQEDWHERLKLLRRQLPANAEEVIQARTELANLLVEQRDFDQARALYQQNLEAARAGTPSDREKTAAAADDLVFVLVEMGRYDEAEPLAREAAQLSLTAWEQAGNKSARELFAISLGHLAAVEHKLGNLARARAHYEQALDVTREIFGEQSAQFAMQLNNLAQLVYEQRDPQQYLELQKRATAIQAKLCSPEHPDYLKMQDNMALALRGVGQHEAAEQLFREVWEADCRILGEEHPQTVSVMLNLAVQLQYLDRHDEAGTLYKRAIGSYSKSLGNEHPLTANAILSWGMLEARQGNHSHAVELLTRAIAIRSAAYGPEHPETTFAKSELAKSLHSQGKIDAARGIYEQAFQARLKFAKELLPTLSEAEALEFVSETKQGLGPLLSLYRQEETKEAYEAVWHVQTLATQAQTARHEFINLQPEQKALVEELAFTRNELARLSISAQTTDGNQAVQQRLNKLSERKEQLERELGRQFDRQYKVDVPTVSQLTAALPQGVAVVHFVRHSRIRHLENQPDLESTDIYAAFVIRKDDSAEGTLLSWIDLGDADLIDGAIDLWRREIRRGAGVVRGVRRARPPTDTLPEDVDAGFFLRGEIWEPLESQLTGCDKVLIVPDGSLSGVPWGALPGKQPGRYLIEEFSLSTLSQPWQLPLLFGRPALPLETCLLVGGIDYGAGQPATKESRAAESAASSKHSSWPYLPETLTEIQGILALTNSRTATKLLGKEANELSLCARLSESHVVHLATHGFFAPGDTENPLSASRHSADGDLDNQRYRLLNRNPLLLSGLVVAGANNPPSLDRLGLPIGGDGILMAEEIASLNLQNTQLVVLSACETGLGKVAGGEGVFGLQRAFRIAGTRTVIASLWKVDDAATQSLMIEFYRNLWVRGLGKQESLRQAQLAMLRGKLFKAAESKDLTLPPRYWAAFSLSGDWR